MERNKKESIHLQKKLISITVRGTKHMLSAIYYLLLR